MSGISGSRVVKISLRFRNSIKHKNLSPLSPCKNEMFVPQPQHRLLVTRCDALPSTKGYYFLRIIGGFFCKGILVQMNHF